MKEDITTIKKLDNPSLRLLGFKPRNTLKPYHNLRSSYFLYPDEEVNFSVLLKLSHQF